MVCVSQKDTRLVGVDDRGNRVGEDHPRARLSNHEVDLIRELADPADGAAPMPLREIARKFDISSGTVHDIVHFRRRASYATAYRRVTVIARGALDAVRLAEREAVVG